MIKIKLLVLGIFVSLSVFAQPEEDIPELVTDRPDQTESAAIVPKGHFQIETGFVLEGDESGNIKAQNLGLLTTLLRYGINKNFELRVGSAFLQSTQKTDGTETSDISGLAPLFFGIKFKMLEENGLIPDMAFLITTEFPNTGAKEFSPEYNATDMRFNIEYSLSNRLGVGANLGARWDGSNPQAEGIYSLVFGYGVTEKLSAFIESYGFVPQEAKPDHRLDAGITFLVKDNFQLDASGGIGLSEISPDYFINAGFSWRIPN